MGNRMVRHRDARVVDAHSDILMDVRLRRRGGEWSVRRITRCSGITCRN